MTKKILNMLRQTDRYVSGQELCRRLNVSRTAVWKRIRQLQEEGYEIEAVPHKGYRLTGWPDTIAAKEVESRLSTVWAGHPVYYFETIDSTNQYAKKAAENGAPEGTLVIADEQTGGKGRLGRHWTTPPKTAVAMTIVLRPTLPPERISMATLVMGYAAARACRQLYDLDVQIKWPNDLVIRGRKLSGTLTEMSAEMNAVNYIVIGIGINANMKEFPQELSATATSLTLELGHDVNRAELVSTVLECFEEDYESFLEKGDLSLLQDGYNKLLVNAGKEVRVLEPGHEYTGTALGISEKGELLVRTEDGSVIPVYAGEVSVRGVYGYV